jgi:microcystin-dependent protein
MPINQNTALFSLLGTFYGGNGQTTFALPDLRGRTPSGAGTSVDGGWQPSPYTIGQSLGSEAVTLGQSELPAHNHMVAASNQNGVTRNPTNSVYGAFTTESIYASAGSGLSPLNPAQLQNAGSSQPHSNIQPYLAVNFNIALNGIFPARG